MLDKKVWALAILAIFGLTACATMQGAGQGLPLPNDINIIAPSPDLPKDIAAFSGKWVGTWDFGLDQVWVIEKIDDKEAQILSAWGGHVRTGIKPGYARITGKVISDPKPEIVLPQKGWGDLPLSLKMEDSNTLKGERTINFSDWVGRASGKLNTITLQRAK